MNKGIIVDIGTGDGKFIYNLAKQYPNRLFIGIDPNHKGLVKTSLRATKKKKRGGLENVVYVLASIKELPKELNNVANQVFINFPWGSLLRSIVKVEQKAWENLKMIIKKCSFIDIIFGYDPIIDKPEVDRLGLPTLSNKYIQSTMVPKIEALGFKLRNFKKLNTNDLKTYPTTWSKKIAFGGKERSYYHLQFTLIEKC